MVKFNNNIKHFYFQTHYDLLKTRFKHLIRFPFFMNKQTTKLILQSHIKPLHVHSYVLIATYSKMNKL